METLPPGTWEWFVAQGGAGILAMLALFGLGYVYRAREKDRLAYEARLEAYSNAHKIEKAELIKLNMDLQEKWRDEIRQFSKSSSDLQQARIMELQLAKGR